MRKIIEKTNVAELVDFLVEYAAHDAKFANAVRTRFTEPDFRVELAKISAEIDDALEGASDYRHHGSWGWVDVNTTEIVFEIEQRVRQGHIRLAFAALETLYLKLLENFEYQSECEISDEAERCLDFMAEVAEASKSAADREYIYEHCIDLAYVDDGKDYGANYEGELLAIAARFVTQDNREKLDNAIAEFEADWCAEAFKLIRLTMIRRLDGKPAADLFIEENLNFPKIREIAYNAAIEQQQFGEAERLCIDAAIVYDRRKASPWLYKLYAVYETIGDSDKLAKTAEQILLTGNLEYYEKLKALLVDGDRWREAYPALLERCAEQLLYTQYMRILSDENELERLFEQLKLHTEQVYTFGAVLAARYGDEVREIFIARIDSEAEKAGNRDAYHGVCGRIAVFAKAGYAANAAKMIDDYKLRYKRRPAFVDELTKLKAQSEFAAQAGC